MRRLRVAVIGGGFTGLTAARRLAQGGVCDVTLLERGSSLGGLAGDFTLQGAALEKTYHHLFRTDKDILALVDELGLTDKLEWRPSSVGIYCEGEAHPFMSPLDVLRFKPCNFLSRVRLGLVALYLQKSRDWRRFSNQSARQWMLRACGRQAMNAVWGPLLRGKFHHYDESVSMAWLWARIHTRGNSRETSGTEKLGYFQGGFAVVTRALAAALHEAKVNVELDARVEALNAGPDGVNLQVKGDWREFDRCIFTGPCGALSDLLAGIPGMEDYRHRLDSIHYLGAVSLVFATDQKLSDYYWLNINQLDAPFLVFIRHTRLVEPEHYNGKEIYYIGSYQPHDSPLFLMDEEKVVELWFQFLRQIHPAFDQRRITEKHFFKLRCAQHIVDTAYEARIPDYRTPLPGLYLANFAQVFPEDRGTNFSVREGLKIADLVPARCASSPGMTEEAKTPPPLPNARPAPLNLFDWCGLAALAVAMVLAVSQQSFWIDEASTGAIAMQSSVREAWRQMVEIRGSDMQMPLYMFYEWAAEKVTGRSEWGLRAAGLLWLLPGLFIYALAQRRRAERCAFVVAAATASFAWYYAGEARPYAMQLGLAFILVTSIARLMDAPASSNLESKWLFVFLGGLVCLCASSLLGVIWAGAATGALLFLTPREKSRAWLRRYWIRFGAAALVLTGLAAYYRWTLASGARASAAARTDWQTVAFLFYEQLGFSGLGPGRTDLRTGGARLLIAYAPGLTAYGILAAWTLWHGLAEGRRRPYFWRAALWCAAPAAALIGLGVVMRFRILGRHLTPLTAVWIILFSLGVARMWRLPGWLRRAGACAFLGLSLYSALSLRFSQRQERDDYRAAAQQANAALSRGKTVWWDAAPGGAMYYHVPAAGVAQPRAALLAVNSTDAWLESQSLPDLIVASKGDLFDNAGALGRYIKAHGFYLASAFPAFQIWEAPPLQ